MFNEIPLSQASLSEVLARVSFRLIERRFRLLRDNNTPITETISALSRQLDRKGWTVMSTWVSAYAYASSNGERPEFVRTVYVFRARLGLPWRDVVYSSYKATRKHDPRVTNRGVTATATERGPNE